MTAFVRLNLTFQHSYKANQFTEALSKVKKTEDDDEGETSEPEDPMMLAREAKDWKVSLISTSIPPHFY